MFILIVTIVLMIVVLMIVKLIYNFFMKEAIFRNFDYRLPNDDIEFNKEYVHSLKEPVINQQTVDDLELLDVFKMCNYTYTDIGKEYMYGRMFESDPQYDLLERTIEKVDDLSLRKKMIYDLYQLSRQYSSCLRLFQHSQVLSPFDKILIIGLSCALLILIILALVMGIEMIAPFIMFYLAVVMGTYSYYNRKTQRMMSQAMSYCYLVECLNKLIKEHVFLDADEEKIKPIVKRAKRYTLITRICYQIEKIDVLHAMDVIKGLLLIPIYQCMILMNHKDELSDDLLTMYQYVGTVDLAVSVYTLRKNHQTCIPKYSSSPIIAFQEGYHPLLSNPVKNSFSTQESCIITGSNASGKSTFIKMIGVNTVLAKTLHTCFADEWTYYPYQLCTSIHMKDDLESGDSYFVKEIKTLKTIVDLSQTKRCLIFIDEILRGTNERERVAISKVLLKTMFESQSHVFVTTHDLSIVNTFDTIQKYCFNDYVNQEQLCSDYKIREGVCQVGNAIALLKVYGFSQDILDQLR